MATIEGISIELSQVRQTAGTIRQKNSALDAKLQEIQQEINALQSFWQSDASETYRQKFGQFAQKRFPEYKSVIESYAQFLEQTVDAYTQTEQSINTSASAFQ
ncbi:MAG: pore-forming ESAT-6 family protein [Oscillospiraceae bacterium]|jgi:WXG100 family type VII secretion target|nr:pore-forming ESAT-6 family protein [Oscillospiraceae bacterium]